MTAKETITKEYLKTNIPQLKPGDTIRVHQKISSVDVSTEKGKKKEAKKEGERIQVFEGVVIALKHGKGVSGTYTVRRISGGVGVERIFPLHCPTVEKIEVVAHGKARRAKLYYLRNRVGKKAKIKRKALIVPELSSALPGAEKKEVETKKSDN